MEKGHIELKEVLLIALVVIGLAAAVLVFMNGSGSTAPPDQAEGNVSVQAEPESPAPDKEETAPPEETAEEVPSEPLNVTNQTIRELLNEGLERADSRFYSHAGAGQYDIKTYEWAMGKMNASPDSIAIKENDIRASEVRFNNKYDDSLRGFAYRIYQLENLGGPPTIYCVAVFISGTTPLDGFDSTFIVNYGPHPQGTQNIEGCTLLSSSQYQTVAGTPLKTYDLSCKIAYGASP